MSGIDKLIERRKQHSSVFERKFRTEDTRLKAAVALMKLREERTFAKGIGRTNRKASINDCQNRKRKHECICKIVRRN